MFTLNLKHYERIVLTKSINKFNKNKNDSHSELIVEQLLF